MMSEKHEKSIASIAEAIDQVLCPILHDVNSCALLDFPNYSNVGDSAIWLGEIEWLRRNGISITYSSDIYAFSPEALGHNLGSSPILLSGGGNFGDLWYDHQRFREHILSEFRENVVIQLPQSVNFLNEWSIAEASRVIASHRHFTLLVRDRRSLNIALTELGANAQLCPDMAFAMGPRQCPSDAIYDVVWLKRTDAEAVPMELPQADIKMKFCDWIEEESTSLVQENDRLFRLFFEGGDPSASVVEELQATFEPLALQRFDRGLGMLSEGRVVVTDRLHAHILATLMGIPNVILDNSYSKLRGFYQAWTSDLNICEWAETPEQAVSLAQRLLSDLRHSDL